MAEPSQSVIINIPTGYSASQRNQIGKEIVRFIQSRTRKGLNIQNKPFKAYSQSYKDDLDFSNAGKSNTVNLTLTGEMLNTLTVLSTGLDFITVGFDDTDGNDKASFNRQNGRQFVGITPKDLNSILSAFTRESGETAQVTQSLATSFLRGLFSGQ